MPCGSHGCKCCATISKKCRVTSTHNNKTYPTQTYTCCSTRNIIYLLECTKCTKGNQYLGHTTKPLQRKLTEHYTENKTNTNSPLYKHFLQKAGHDFERDTKVTILKTTTRNHLLETEQLDQVDGNYISKRPQQSVPPPLMKQLTKPITHHTKSTTTIYNFFNF